MERRRFILALGVGGGVGALAGAWGVGLHRASVVDQLRSLLLDVEGAREIGLVYLSKVPEERDPDALGALITEGINWPVLSGGDARQLLDARIRRDFASEEVVRLHGWILSRTEARLCALAALDAMP
jgi:hypothetical protein